MMSAWEEHIAISFSKTKTPHTLEVHLDTSYVHLNLEDPKCCISETLNVISFFPGPGLKYRIWGFVGSIHRYLLLWALLLGKGIKADAYLSAMPDSLWRDRGPGTILICFDD